MAPPRRSLVKMALSGFGDCFLHDGGGADNRHLNYLYNKFEFYGCLICERLVKEKEVEVELVPRGCVFFFFLSASLFDDITRLSLSACRCSSFKFEFKYISDST